MGKGYGFQFGISQRAFGMNSDSRAPSSGIELSRSDATSSIPFRKPVRRALKYVMFIVILSVWIVAPLISFSHPILSERLVWVYFACALILFFLFLGAAFRRRRKEVAILLAIWAVILAPYYHLGWSLWRLRVVAFRVHVLPIDKYLSRCKLVQFVENGIKQSVGICERFGLGNEEYETVVYDSTGEFILPASQRTPEWTRAMGHFEPSDALIKSEGRAVHLYQNFYDVILSIYEGDPGLGHY